MITVIVKIFGGASDSDLYLPNQSFVTLPRSGETLYIRHENGDVIARVTEVEHFSAGANGAPSVQLCCEYVDREGSAQ